MDDSLILDGKKYISASRVSKISGYNSDYLGQLCRSDKLDCKLISRTWFVTKESLAEHQKNSGRKKNLLITSEQVYREKIDLKDFYSDNQKILLDSLRKDQILKSLSFGQAVIKQFDKNLVVKFLVGILVSTSVIAILFNANNFINVKGKSAFKNVIEQQASLEDINTIKNLINDKLVNFQDKIKVVFKILIGGESDRYLVRDDSDGYKILTPKYDERDNSGAVMIPISESDKSNVSKVKNYLKNSFSDEIEIVPDESGVAGVIKPVFADPKEEEYFYVMVPVR